MERGPAREAVAAGQQTQSGALDPTPRARKAAEKAPLAPGLEFPRYFTLAGVDVTLAIGELQGRYDVRYRDYRLAETAGKLESIGKVVK